MQPAMIDHGSHRGIVRQTFGIVHILLAGEASEHRLAQQSGQQVVGILATAAFQQCRTRQIGQPERIVQFAIGQKASIGGDAAAVELELQPAVEIDPQGAVIRFTRRVFHPRAPSLTTTR